MRKYINSGYTLYINLDKNKLNMIKELSNLKLETGILRVYFKASKIKNKIVSDGFYTLSNDIKDFKRYKEYLGLYFAFDLDDMNFIEEEKNLLLPYSKDDLINQKERLLDSLDEEYKSEGLNSLLIFLENQNNETILGEVK